MSVEAEARLRNEKDNDATTVLSILSLDRQAPCSFAAPTAQEGTVNSNIQSTRQHSLMPADAALLERCFNGRHKTILKPSPG